MLRTILVVLLLAAAGVALCPAASAAEVIVYPDEWHNWGVPVTVISGSLADVQQEDGVYMVVRCTTDERYAVSYRWHTSYVPAEVTKITFEYRAHCTRGDTPNWNCYAVCQDGGSNAQIWPGGPWPTTDQWFTWQTTEVSKYLSSTGYMSFTWCGCPQNGETYDKYADVVRIRLELAGGPEPPVADFSGSPTSGDAPLVVNFTDLSTNSPTSWSWDFGDTGTSTAQNPSHEYTAEGTYTVSLTATNASGSDTETKTGYITVTEPQPTIFSDDFEAALNWTTSGDVAWYTGTPKNGTHSVRLRTTGQIEKTISTAGYESIGVTFYMGANSLDNAGENLQCLWYNGSAWTVLKQINDGDPEENNQLNYFQFSLPAGASNKANFALRFKLNGSGTGDYGYIDDVVVSGDAFVPSPPVADFSGSPTSGVAPLTVNFTDLSTNNPTSWSWDFGDTGTSTAQNPSHQYAAGTYTVSLTATNAGGSDTETKTGYITVTVPAPVADFSGSPTSGDAPLTVNFTDLSTNSPTSWSWDFGDTGTSTAQNPSHEYTSAGDYTVSLTATNAGGSDTETKTGYITVTVPAPVADFSGSPTSGDAPLTVNFTDLSTNNPTSWSWNFGDTGTSTAQNPSHEYTSAGDYTVSLTATNAGGSDTLTRVDYIAVSEPPPPAPVADFSGSPTSGDAPLTVNFTDLSTNNPTSWSWNFGDTGTSTAQNPSHQYTSEGNYTVSLTATNAGGSDTETKTGYITVTAGGPTVVAVYPYTWSAWGNGTTVVSGSLADVDDEDDVYMVFRCATGYPKYCTNYRWDTAYTPADVTKITVKYQAHCTRSDTPNLWGFIAKVGGGSTTIRSSAPWPTTDTWCTWETTDVSTYMTSDGKFEVTWCGCPVGANLYDMYVDVMRIELELAPGAAQPPAAPSNLDATALGETQIDLTWTDNSDNEDGFKIEVDEGNTGTFVPLDTVGANVTSYSDTGLTPGTAYCYRVYAYNTYGDSANSNVDCATLTLSPPNAPSNLAAAGVSETQIDLSWTDNSGNEDGFKIEVDEGDTGTFVYLDTVGPNVTSYSDAGLTQGTTYCYRVYAYNSAGNSGYSNSDCAVPTPQPPLAPSGLGAVAVSVSEIDLTWSDNPSNETGFNIQVDEGNTGTFVYLDTVGANVTSYSDTGLTEGTIYCYRVYAYNGAGDSAYSNVACATPQAGNVVTVSTTQELQNAINNATPGTIIEMTSGTYNVVDLGKTNGIRIENKSNLTIRSQTGNRDDVVVKGLGIDDWIYLCFQVLNSDYITFENFTMRDIYYHCVQLNTGSEYATFRNLYMWDAGEGPIKSTVGDYDNGPWCDYGLVEDCVFGYTTTGKRSVIEGIDVIAVYGWVIRDSEFYNVKGIPDMTGYGHGMFAKGGSHDTVMENNYLQDCDIPLSFGGGGTPDYYKRDDVLYEHMGGIMRNNVVNRTRDVGIYMNKASDFRIYNNTIWSTFDELPSSIDSRFSLSYGEIYNNICSQSYQLRDGGTATLSNNIWYASPSLFVNQPNGDFHLVSSATSAIDQGLDTTALVPYDMDWEARPKGSAVDIGADEF